MKISGSMMKSELAKRSRQLERTVSEEEAAVAAALDAEASSEAADSGSGSGGGSEVSIVGGDGSGSLIMIWAGLVLSAAADESLLAKDKHQTGQETKKNRDV